LPVAIHGNFYFVNAEAELAQIAHRKFKRPLKPDDQTEASQPAKKGRLRQ
jgi:hypothetical protein